ncbi:MAG: DUF3109 family protein [Thermonemataceae bacterium]
MIIVGNAYISDDVADQFFVCNLQKCKGACCVEGDAGAPLEQEEEAILEEILEKVAPYMSQAGRKAIAEKGVAVIDNEGDLTTTTVEDKECAFAVYDENGVLACSIERAYNDKKIDFQKPISCHLYPIRITKYDLYDAVNYDRWEICQPACQLGKALHTPLYKFLKEPLVRKYGKDWYQTLVEKIEEASLSKE